MTDNRDVIMSSTEELSLVTRSTAPYTESRDTSGLDTLTPDRNDDVSDADGRRERDVITKEEPSANQPLDELLATTHEAAMQVTSHPCYVALRSVCLTHIDVNFSHRWLAPEASSGHSTSSWVWR